MTTHTSILAWEIPWTEEPGGLHLWGHKRVRHDVVTKQHQQQKQPETFIGRGNLHRNSNSSPKVCGVLKTHIIQPHTCLPLPHSGTRNALGIYLEKCLKLYLYKAVNIHLHFHLDNLQRHHGFSSVPFNLNKQTFSGAFLKSVHGDCCYKNLLN